MKDRTGCTPQQLSENILGLVQTRFVGAMVIPVTIDGKGNDKIHPWSHIIQRKDTTKAVACQSYH